MFYSVLSWIRKSPQFNLAIMWVCFWTIDELTVLLIHLECLGYTTTKLFQLTSRLPRCKITFIQSQDFSLWYGNIAIEKNKNLERHHAKSTSYHTSSRFRVFSVFVLLFLFRILFSTLDSMCSMQLRTEVTRAHHFPDCTDFCQNKTQ